MRRRALAALALAALAAGCGGGGQSSEDAARATVQRYLAALGRGDAAAACRELTRRSQDSIADAGVTKLRLTTRSCEATIDRALHAPNGPQLRRLGRAKITRVAVHGDRAEVSVEGVAGRTSVVRADGAWRMESTPSGERD